MSDQVAPNDTAITEAFLSVKEDVRSTLILVNTIYWESPSTPSSDWVVAEKIPGPVSPETIRSAIRRILNNRRFFSICQECGERNPQGWMHDEDICQRCAEKNHGVVY